MMLPGQVWGDPREEGSRLGMGRVWAREMGAVIQYGVQGQPPTKLFRPLLDKCKLSNGSRARWRGGGDVWV